MISIVVDLRNKLHNLAYICLGIIYLLMGFEFFIEYLGGYRDLYSVLGFILMLISMFCLSISVSRIKAFKHMEYWVICVCYLISYTTCLQIDITKGSWLYIFPFGCVLLLFFHDMRVIYFGVIGFTLVNILYQIHQWDISSSIDKLFVFQRCACLCICSIMIVTVAYFLNYVFKRISDLYNKAANDNITGTKSKAYFDDIVKSKITCDCSNRYSFGLVDVHDFYRYNELYDYSFGDSILRAVAKTIFTETKVYEDRIEVCRQYGGRFLVCFCGVSSEEAIKMCKKVNAKLHKYVLNTLCGNEVFIETSIMVTDTDLCGRDYDIICKRLEQMLSYAVTGDCIVDSQDWKVNNDNGSDNREG